LDAGKVDELLRREIDRTRQAGGKVYFLGLFDLSEEEWSVFMAQRLKLPYTLLQPYKRRATPVLTLRTRTPDGTPSQLWNVVLPD
jgi:hypothetical protein